MTSSRRVAWSEGMFLRPQHFQQQERFLESVLEGRVAALRPHAWGITELVVNEDLLAVGKYGLRKISCVMPDGTTILAPGDIELPPPVDVPTDARSAMVFLTLPPRQPGAQEFSRALTAGEVARYVVDGDEAIDNFALGRAAEEIETGRPNIRIGITKEQTEGRILVPLSRIVERRDKQVLLDGNYIPPSLTLEAHAALQGIVEDIGGRATARADELSKRATAKIEAGSETLISFLMLQALNRWTPLFKHLRTCPGYHPESLFSVLLQLAGDMSTFTTAGRRPPTFPDYDHLDIQRCYRPVLDFLVAAFSTVFDRAAVQLDLVMRGPSAFVCPIRDRNLFLTASIFLAVSARRPAKEIADRFSSQITIGSLSQMPDLVRSAVSGIPIRHVTTLPPQMPTFHEMTYFQLDQSSSDWRDIASAAPAVGLAVAGEWPDLKLEAWAVKRTSG